MSHFKKLSAILLAGVMILGIRESVFAAGTHADTYMGNTQTTISTTSDNTIELVKSIVFVNANGSSVYEPNISFTYTVAPAGVTDGAKSVTDSTGKTAHVYNGVADAITGTTTITFSPDNTAVTTSATGVEVEKTGNIIVDVSKFEHAGVYRYVITEGTADVVAKGLTSRETTYTTIRYLDVYIKNGDSGLEMYGAVIFKSSTANGADDISISTSKTTGFEPSGDSTDLKNDADVDRYVTYDFMVKKTISGGLADKTHEFPFYVTVSNTISGAKYTYTADGGTATAETISETSIKKGSDATTSDLKLKNDDYITFVGVPSNQTTDLSIVTKEFNDTNDAYTPTVSATKGTITMASTNEAKGNAITALTGSDTTSSFDIKTNDVANQIISINNELAEISPTGVILRFAPYALMLAAGIILLTLSRRRRSVE